jgi:hypothetical protein
LVDAPPSHLHRRTGVYRGVFRWAVPLMLSQEVYPLTSSPPLQSWPCPPPQQRPKARPSGVLATRCALRYFASRLRPATRSPGGASPEVLFPFSAISAVSPFLGTGQPRLLAARQTPVAGLPHPRHFHLQGFSPSWWLSPHSTSPVCFTQQALMGFRARPSICCAARRPKAAYHLAQHAAASELAAAARCDGTASLKNP